MQSSILRAVRPPRRQVLVASSRLVRRHREPSTHSCILSADTSKDPLPEKNAAAKALLAKHFGPSPTPGDPTGARSSAPKPSNPKKEEQLRKVAAMKMRHQAQPGDPKDTATSVPMGQRLHLKVSRTGAVGSERVFWFRKVTFILALHAITSLDSAGTEHCHWESSRPLSHPLQDDHQRHSSMSSQLACGSRHGLM